MSNTTTTCDNDYFNLYMTQLFQTLGQLSAALLTTTLAVPVYSFYTRYNRNTDNTHYEIFEENSNFVDSNNNTAENTCDDADIDADIDADDADIDDDSSDLDGFSVKE